VTQQKGVLKKILDKFRYGLFFLVLFDYLSKVGIKISFFYWMKEGASSNPPTNLDKTFDEYEFCFFGPEEIAIINDLPERQFANKRVFINLLNSGKKCFGVKHQGKIAAFNWFGLEESGSKSYPVAMKDNEAYLFDMYVLKAFRGKKLAPILRRKSYAVLQAMGRDTYYSISDCFNTPTIKFKDKLNAQFILKGLYINLFRKFERRWVLKKY